MADEERVREALRSHGANRDFAIVDAGGPGIAPAAYAAAIRSLLDGNLVEVGRDRNSVCYRTGLADGGASVAAVVKVPRPGPQRTNPDASFAGEAAVLARLVGAGIDGVPRLLARVHAAGRHYLFTTELPGSHPDPRRHPLDGAQLAAILDRLGALDRRGLMHYDLKAGNVLVGPGGAALIDFEFAQFGDQTHAYAPARQAWSEDFNVSGNPHFPARSNVANFEFRTLHRYLAELAATHSPAAAEALWREYLRVRSRYHERMARYLGALAVESGGRIAAAGGLSAAETARRLDAATRHERMLAALLAEPAEVLARVERNVMAYRRHVFERRDADAQAARREVLAALADAAAADALPQPYARSARRIVGLVARSVHPPA